MKSVCYFPLSQGKWAVVDLIDAGRVSEYKWSAKKGHAGNFYAFRHGGHKLHRFLVPTGKGELVDHIDGDGLNNCQSNLRCCSPAENGRNISKRTTSPTTSKFKGVSWNKERGRWYVSVSLNGKQIYLGQFTCEEKAARAYNEGAKKFFGEFARLNEL